VIPMAPGRMRKRHRANNKHHEKTDNLPATPEAPEWRARTRGKILYMPKRSLCRQLQQLATHFPLQNQKYARNTPLDALAQDHQFCAPEQRFRILSAGCNEISLLKTKHFTPRLLTTGLHVRIRTGEPLCFRTRK
jgi:hypothetical protein